jgi:hypothetical protein
MYEFLLSRYSPMLPFQLFSKIPLWLQLYALFWYAYDLHSFFILLPISTFYELQCYD